MPNLFILITFCALHLTQSSPVVFIEDEEHIDFQTKQDECWSNGGMVYWNETDQCYRPATPGPCPEGEWIILTDDPSQVSSVKCRSRPCPMSQALFNNTCHPTDQRTTKRVCSAQEVLINSPFGHGHCVCKKGYILWEDGQCYQPYQRGPCPEGKYLQYNQSIFSSNSLVKCVPNTCKHEELIPYAGSCFKLGDHAACGVPEETLEIDFDSLQPKCLDANVQVRQIAIVRYHCGAGSPLLRTRYCRPPFEFGKPYTRN